MSWFRQVLRALKCRLLIAHYGLPHAHRTAYIAYGSQISRDLVAQEYTYVGHGCMIGGRVTLGAYSMLAARVTCMGDDHRYDRPGVPIIFSGRPEMRSTVIGRDVWVGTGSILLSGVEIGDGAIIAAGTVVSRSVAACEIHGGVPNRKIRDRFDNPEDARRHLEFLRGTPTLGQFAEKRY